MQQNVYDYLKSRPDLIMFVRYNPIWYRYLTRDPERVYELDQEAKLFYGKTLPQRLEKMNDHVQMIRMFITLTGVMKD